MEEKEKLIHYLEEKGIFELEQLKQIFENKYLIIPIEISSSDLSLGEKMVLGEILALSRKEPCYATNEYIGNLIGISKRHVSRILNSLKKKGIIEIKLEKSKGTFRTIILKKRWTKCLSRVDKMSIPGRQNVYQRNKQKEIDKNNIFITKAPKKALLIEAYFIKKFKEKFRKEPAIAYSKERKLINQFLKKYSFEEAIDLIDKFFNSKVGEKLGYSLSICFSSNVKNLWLAGKLEKKKRPFWNGYPLRKKFGKWEVLVNGEWKEFAGSKKEIVYK